VTSCEVPYNGSRGQYDVQNTPVPMHPKG